MRQCEVIALKKEGMPWLRVSWERYEVGRRRPWSGALESTCAETIRKMNERDDAMLCVYKEMMMKSKMVCGEEAAAAAAGKSEVPPHR